MSKSAQPIHFVFFVILLQSALGAMFAKERPTNETSPHDATPGIEIQTLNIPQVGKFCTWDCAGQSEYHVTHGMFLGSGNSIFLLVYDITAEKHHKQVRLEAIIYSFHLSGSFLMWSMPIYNYVGGKYK